MAIHIRCSIHEVKKLLQFRDCSSEWLYRMSDCSCQVEESRLSLEYYSASPMNCLKESIQWVSCVVFVTTFPYHCTLQEHMVNCQCLTTMVTRSRRSTGQDMGLGGLVMANRSRVIITSSALVKCWNVFGGPSVGFKRYRCLPCTATSHLVWTSCWI